MIKDRNLSYSERLNRLNITTLETRRLRGDLIQVFKIFKGLNNVQYSDFFIMADTELRGHELKVYKPQVHLDIRLYVNISFQSELLMHGIIYRLRFYVATLMKIKKNLTVFSRIGVTNKLSAFFPLVNHSLWWVVR